MTIHELLLRRFATKKFDPTKKVSDDDLAYILEAARLSCSSANTQPWFITVVTNAELRAKLREAGYGQSQITDASHLLVLSCMKDPMVRIEKTAALIQEKAGAESAEGYKKMVTGWIPATPEGVFGWFKPQTYLALQAMILAAAEKGIDSCPMEGFNPGVFAELLGLTDKTPCALLPIGYAAEPGHPKVRVPMEDIVEYRK
jgi:nitroreductase